MKCDWITCKEEAIKGIYCFQHNRVYGVKSPKSAPTPIAKKSEKFKVEHKEYTRIVKDMLKENDKCQLSTPVCIKTAQGLHHMKRRGKNLLNKDYLMRACNPCNSYLEQFPLYAKEKGLSLSKF